MTETIDDDTFDDEKTPSVRRLPASGIHVAIKVERASDHVLWSDVTMDVARGGVFVATIHPLEVGTLLHLLVTLEGDDVPLAAQGIVCWTRAHREGSDGAAGVGIRFIDLDEKTIAKLRRFATCVREPMLFEVDEEPVRQFGGTSKR